MKRANSHTLSHEEILRYSRHLIMPEVGMAGQEKLKMARVLIVGTGGLGSPVSMYLAAAGVGHLGLIDFDQVDITNLHRQLLYTTEDVGKPKIQQAVARLKGVNPHVQIETFETRLTSENAMEIIKPFDIVADGTDNFPTRYLVNDACVLLGKPNVYGSIFRFEGQATVFDAARGPCYRCLYPEPPPPGLVPSCAEGGVLGVLPGIVGLIQATEAIKLILGTGEPLIGRLLLYNALRMTFRELKLQKYPQCPICGPKRTITQLADYNEFCGVQQPAQVQGDVTFEIQPDELRQRLERNEVRLIDVREPEEYAICHINGSQLIPMSEFRQRLHELDSAEEIVLYCHHGIRSRDVANFLYGMGFRKVHSLSGGIDEWAEKVEPSLPRY